MGILPPGGGRDKHAGSSHFDQSNAAWSAQSGRLASWAERHVVNRRDVYGKYLPIEERSGRDTAPTCKGQLPRAVLERHFQGRDQGALVGLHVISPDNTCRWVLIDIDQHGKYDSESHKRNRRAAIEIHNR